MIVNTAVVLAFVAMATAQPIDFDNSEGKTGGRCQTTQLSGPGISTKQDFVLDLSSAKRIVRSAPGFGIAGAYPRNVEGIRIAAPNAALDSTEAQVGSRSRTLRRLTPNAYSDGFDTPRGQCDTFPNGTTMGFCLNLRGNAIGPNQFVGSNLPNPRTVSRLVSTSEAVIASRRNMHQLTADFGQFLAHDTTLAPEDSGEGVRFDIVVPEGDPIFDPQSTGTETIFFRRSVREERCSGRTPRGSQILNGIDLPREMNNEISAFIDGTMVYGGQFEREALLRDNRTGRPGQLLTGPGNLLPFNTFNNVFAAQDNPRGTPLPELFFGGDRRTVEAPQLTVMITIFVREHNRLARHHAAWLRKNNKPVISDVVYTWAKKIVIAELQRITFEEWLPSLLGEAFPAYNDFVAGTNPDLYHEFSAATRRFGHSLVNGFIPVLFGKNRLRGVDRADLATHLFNVQALINRADGGIEPILRGFLCLRSQQLDTVVTPGLQQRLFAGEPGLAERDLVAINIMRGREHGIADYNSVRVALGLPRLTTFSQINPSDPQLTANLADIYGSVDNIDLFIGALAEQPASVEPAEGTSQRGTSEFGETIRAMFLLQFRLIRDADSMFYLRSLTARERRFVPTFAEILRRNSKVYPPNLFPTTHSIFFHPLFCRAVRNNQCVPRSARKENLLCDRVYNNPNIPDVANSTQPSQPSLSFPWRLR